MAINLPTKAFKDLGGYNANPRVNYEHVFIPGEGCFSETPELARANNRKTGNEVGLYIVTRNHEGRDIFLERQSNLFD